jgi:hypothetical protein
MFALNWLTGFRGEDLNNFPIGPPLADIVLTWDRMGKKCFKIFSSETNQPI